MKNKYYPKSCGSFHSNARRQWESPTVRREWAGQAARLTSPGLNNRVPGQEDESAVERRKTYEPINRRPRREELVTAYRHALDAGLWRFDERA